MVRTQVQLTDKQTEALRRRSKRENVSVAKLVRRAIDVYQILDGQLIVTVVKIGDRKDMYR